MLRVRVLGSPPNRAKYEKVLKRSKEREEWRQAGEWWARVRPDWVIEALKLTLISLSRKGDPKNHHECKMLVTGEETWKLFAKIVDLGARCAELYALIPQAVQANDLYGLLERVGIATMRGLVSWEQAEANEADQCQAIRRTLADIHTLRSDMDRASVQLEQTRQRVRLEVLPAWTAKWSPTKGGREVYLMDGQEREWGPDDGSGIDVYIEDGREVMPRKWSRDVRVPLRQCDYEMPVIARLYPFQTDSSEEAVDYHLAAGLTLYCPFWRRFKLWPICEVNGVRGYRAIHAAYAEMRRTLLECGYSEKDFEQAPLPDIEELLEEGDMRRESANVRTERNQAQADLSERDRATPPTDLISSAVAVKDYSVSRATLRRAVAERRLRDYRPEGHLGNASLRLSRAEVASIWTRRGQ